MDNNLEVKADEGRMRMMSFRITKLERDNVKDKKLTTTDMVTAIRDIIKEEINAVK